MPTRKKIARQYEEAKFSARHDGDLIFCEARPPYYRWIFCSIDLTKNYMSCLQFLASCAYLRYDWMKWDEHDGEVMSVTSCLLRSVIFPPTAWPLPEQ